MSIFKKRLRNSLVILLILTNCAFAMPGNGAQEESIVQINDTDEQTYLFRQQNRVFQENEGGSLIPAQANGERQRERHDRNDRVWFSRGRFWINTGRAFNCLALACVGYAGYSFINGDGRPLLDLTMASLLSMPGLAATSTGRYHLAREAWVRHNQELDQLWELNSTPLNFTQYEELDPPPTTENDLEQSTENGFICSICQITNRNDSQGGIVRIGCPGRHSFCLSCIEEWYKRSQHCPNCRGRIRALRSPQSYLPPLRSAT